MAARMIPSRGSKPDKIWRDAIMRAVHRVGEDGQSKQLERLADKLIRKGLEGDTTALKEIGDRLDGKPLQPIIGSEETPMRVLTRIERVIVDTKD